MAKLPSWRRILEQDYPQKYQDLIQQMSIPLNYGIEVLYNLLNGKLTFKDNIASTIKEFDVQVDANGKPQNKITIKKASDDRIEGLIVVRAQNLTNSTTYPSTGIFITYTETTNTIIIDHITGLQTGNLYRINIITLR
jgi:hypothetical protein